MSKNLSALLRTGSSTPLIIATQNQLGGVIIPAVATSGITNTSGTIRIATASASQLGGVKVDGTTITINGSGVISSAGGIATGASYITPTATGTAAAAFGSGASAGGTSSIALGQSANSSGGSGIAIGENSLASGTWALAVGAATQAVSRTTAIGMSSGASASVAAVSMGAMSLGGSYASGTDSFAAAIGNNTSSYGAQNTSAIAMGQNCKSTGLYGSTAIGVSCIAGIGAIAMGYQSTATGDSSICISNNGSVATSAWSGVFGGGYNTSSGQFSTVLGGASNQATANYSTVIGGNRGNAQQIGKVVFGCAWYTGEIGFAQDGKIVIGAGTTTTTAVVLTSNGEAASTTNQLIVATNQAMTFFGTLIAKQSGSANMASYLIKGAIVNNGGTVSVSTISIETLVDTIGLDTVPTFTADNTNKALAVTSGYKAATTIRWVCNLDSVEVTHA